VLAVAAGGIAGVCLVVYCCNRLIQRRRYNSHSSLFSGLCQVHGLDHSARGLLKQLARKHGLRHPARLFTEPGWLDPARLQGSLHGRAAEVTALRNRLFAAGDTPAGT